MRVLIAGIVVAAVTTACTQGTRGGAAQYSAESRADSATSSAPGSASVAGRRNVPAWPSTSGPGTVAAAPAPYPSRTVAPQPIVLSSRTDTGSVTSPSSGNPAPLPVPRSRSATDIAARLRPINATCPVMLGSPVDPSITTSFNGRVVAFADLSSRSKWLGDPERFVRNLPGAGGFGSASDGPVFASAAAPPSSRETPYVLSAPAAPRVSAPLAAPELPAFAMPPPPPPPLPVVTRSTYVPAPSFAPLAPVTPVAPAPHAVPVVPPVPADADTGGTCTDGDCPGGNCKLPPRRK